MIETSVTSCFLQEMVPGVPVMIRKQFTVNICSNHLPFLRKNCVKSEFSCNVVSWWSSVPLVITPCPKARALRINPRAVGSR